MVFTVEGLHYDELKSGGPSKKHEIATLNLGTISIFALRLNKTKKMCVETRGRKTIHTDF
jgi:hypothetical protein